MLEGIKRFFRSLMFWRQEPKQPQIQVPNKVPTLDEVKVPQSEDEVTDDGVGGEIQEPEYDLPLNNDFPLHYRFAYKEIGTREIRGRNHNPRVLEYHDTTGNFSDDETAWCASFVNWCLIMPYWNEEKGVFIYREIEYQKTHKDMHKLALVIGTGKANARSFSSRDFLNRYQEVKKEDVKVGDIVVLWRGSKNGWMGHVGFVAGFVGKEVKILGGNQANAVNIRNYPLSRVLAFVRV